MIFEARALLYYIPYIYILYIVHVLRILYIIARCPFKLNSEGLRATINWYKNVSNSYGFDLKVVGVLWLSNEVQRGSSYKKTVT